MTLRKGEKIDSIKMRCLFEGHTELFVHTPPSDLLQAQRTFW